MSSSLIAGQQNISSFEPLKAKAASGDVKAQSELALRYAIGWDLPKDAVQAAIWYRKAADQGDVDAQFSIGVAYESGKGVPLDYAMAISWYRKAAEAGATIGQFAMGNMYAAGKGVSQDYGEAVKWYTRAAEQNNPDAQCALGTLYELGRGVPKNLGEAVKWYHKAADQDNAGAKLNLGLMYFEGSGFTQNHAEAVNWIRQAAEQGLADAQSQIGYMYYVGQGVTENYIQALKWLTLASSGGNKTANENLGILNNNITAADIAEGKRQAAAFVPRKSGEKESSSITKAQTQSSQVDIQAREPFLQKRNEVVFVYVVTNRTGSDIALDCFLVPPRNPPLPEAKIYLKRKDGAYVQGNFRFGAILKDEMKVKPAIIPAPCEFPNGMPVTMTMTLHLGDIPRKLNTWRKALDAQASELESIYVVVPELKLKLNFPVPQH